MTRKRIFILNGHPAKTSLSRFLAETYATAARKAGHDVRLQQLSDLEFDADYGFSGYKTHKPLEPDLQEVQQNLEWSEHVVLMTPMWWGGLPAKLKGLFDRTLLPGWAFDTRNTKMGMPLPLLGGRTGRIFITSDTPNLLFGLLYRKALVHQIKGQIFNFIGIKPAKVTHFSPASKPKEGRVKRWSQQVEGLARLAL